MPINVTTDPKTGQQVVETQVPKEFPKPETGYKPIAFSTGKALLKGARDLTQELLGNLPADELSKLRVAGGVPRKPGAPDAPILGILPPLPKVEANPLESVLSSVVQGGIGFMLASRGLRAARGAVMRVPGVGTTAEATGAAVKQAAQPYAQAARTAAGFVEGSKAGRIAVGAGRFAGKVTVRTVTDAPASLVTGYAAFKPEEKRLSDHALRWVEQQRGTPLHNALVDLVRSEPGDTAADARWKNGLEGLMFLDPAANAVVETLGYLARAAANKWRVLQFTKPAAEQVVDTPAQAVAEPPAAEVAIPGKAKGKARAVEVTEAYEAQRRTPMWEKKGVEVQGKLPTEESIAKAEAELQQAQDRAEVAVARAANTVPDVAGAVRPEARGTELPSYSQVRETPVAEIATDPQRFQFKEAGRLTKTGVSGSLKEAAQYDPLFGKIISVWRDPANNQLYVVNGHNRLALAQRSGRQSILTWEIEAPNAEQARAIGAMENMAEGMGTPWDAAKIMRDMGIDPAQLAQRNINVRGPVAEKAIPLSRLPQDIFDKGVTGKLDMAKAIALGSEPLDEAVIRDVAAAAGKGKWSAEKILQAMQEAKFAQTSGPEGGGVLPGMEDLFKTTNFTQLLDIRTEAFKALREEMIALTSAARPGRKGILEAAGNVIDVAGSQAAREQAAAAVEVFNRVTGYTGPVRDLLNEMAAQVKGRRTAAVVVNENIDRLRQAIEDEVKGPRLPLEQPAAAAAPEPAAPAPAPAARPVPPEQAAESKALLDKALATLPPARRAEVQQQLLGTAAAAPEAPAAPAAFRLPDELQKAAPRYSYGSKQFQLRFASDLDRAAYILANDVKTVSKAAPKFRAAIEQAGYDLAQIASHGDKVRAAIKAQAKDAQPGVIELPDQGFGGIGRGPLASVAEEAGGSEQLKSAVAREAVRDAQLRVSQEERAYQQWRDANPRPLPPQEGGNSEEFAAWMKASGEARLPLMEARQTLEEVRQAPVGEGKEVTPSAYGFNWPVLRPEVQEAVMKEIAANVKRVAGEDVGLRFNEAFMLRPTHQAWGGSGKKTQLSFIGGQYDPVQNLIDVYHMRYLALGVKAKISTGYHEAWHAVQFNFLTAEELKALNTFYGQLRMAAGKRPNAKNLIEQQATAFERYAYARDQGLPVAPYMLGVPEETLRGFREVDGWPQEITGFEKLAKDASIAAAQIFDRLVDFVEKVGNYFQKRGWTSTRDIFEQAYSGEMAAARRDMPSAYEAMAEGDDARVKILAAIENRPEIQLTDINRRLGLYSEEPEGPRPVDPPSGPENSDDWVRRFAKQLEANRQALLNGEVTMEDLMANNFQKVQSPSGRTVYTAKREDLVDGLNAMSKVLPDRPTESGIPVFNVEEVRRFNQDWFARHGEDGEAIMAGLKSLTRGFDEYQQGALNRAMAYADKKQIEAAQEAAMWLNSANIDGLNESERLARLVTAAESSRATHQSIMRVTRRWGQLGLEMQVPRDYDIPPNQNIKDAEIPEAPVQPDAPRTADQEIDVDAEIKAELENEQARPIEDTITNKVDPELTDAINGGEITPKAQAAADALAQSLVTIGADPKARTRFWRNWDETELQGPNALLMLRTNNLISGGATTMTNVMNGMINLTRLPLQQAAGAALQGEFKRSMYSLMMFQQYWMNLTNAVRTAGHAFKAGQSLFNMESSTVDYLSRVAKEEAQGELMQGPEQMTGWTVNTMNMGEEFAQKPIGQLANHLWRVLGTGATRIALSIDTFNSTLAGYAFEHVRHLPRGMELAVERGMKEYSPEAWKWAQQYADARTQETVKDAVINGKNLADIHMDSPHAQKFMDSVNFTDKIWAELEPRTYGEGVRLGLARGLKDQELQAFAKQYVDEGMAINKMANFFLAKPIGRLASIPGEAMDTLANARYAGPVFKFIQPFIRVPNNIIKSAARNTPAAAFVDTFWRDISSEDPFTRDRALGEMATGSAVLAMATMASAMGYIRFNGGGPIDPAARQKWTQIEGRLPYSIQFWSEEEGKWAEPVSLRALEPFTTLFGAIGDYADIAASLSTEDRNRLGGALVLTLARMSTVGVLSKSYFQGFNEVYEAAFNPSKVITGPNQRDAFARYLSRIAASMVPYSSALRAGRREVDPVARSVDPSDIGGLMGFFQETLDEVRNAVPGWSNDLPARRDFINGAPILTTGILGAEQVPAEWPWLQALMQFTPMSAMQVGRQPSSPVHQEMARLHGKGTNFTGPRAADFGAEMRLTPSELEDYVLTFATVKNQFGQTFEQAATELINSPQYQSWPIEAPSKTVSLRAAAIQQLIQEHKELAKAVYKVSTAKGQLIQAEQDATKADLGEKDYLRRYGGGTATPEQPGVQSWSITPGKP